MDYIEKLEQEIQEKQKEIDKVKRERQTLKVDLNMF